MAFHGVGMDFSSNCTFQFNSIIRLKRKGEKYSVIERAIRMIFTKTKHLCCDKPLIAISTLVHTLACQYSVEATQFHTKEQQLLFTVTIGIRWQTMFADGSRLITSVLSSR